jgi:hypothetical protein
VISIYLSGGIAANRSLAVKIAKGLQTDPVAEADSSWRGTRGWYGNNLAAIRSLSTGFSNLSPPKADQHPHSGGS